MDTLAQMIFGLQCCAAKEENKSCIVSRPAEIKKTKNSKRSKPAKHFTEHSNQSITETTYQWNLHSSTVSTPRLDASFSSSSPHPSRASIAADNALVGEPRYPASGSSVPCSAFATATPRPNSRQQEMRYHRDALQQSIPSASLAREDDVFLSSSTVKMLAPNWESKLLHNAARP